MHFRRLKLRFRRQLQRTEQQVEGFGEQAEQQIERHFFRRFDRLAPVRRFIIGWLLLVVLLIGGVVAQGFNLSNYYQSLRPVPGGIYNEGVLGTFTTANPLYATNDVDSSVAHLVFAGLFTYNQQNQLTGDLASGYSVDAHRTVYTVQLKPNLTWQDGKPLTSADVLFTYKSIQNPDAQSPLLASWQGITVTAPDARTVVFTLPDPLASFPYTLTNGIVPAHLLSQLPMADLRSADFNTIHPIGSGPFSWQAIQVSGANPTDAQEQIGFAPFKGYNGGAPKLQQFVIHAYADPGQLTRAFQGGSLNGASGLTAVPKDLNKATMVHSIILTAGNYVFFKTSSGMLADAKLRQALVEASDTHKIISQLDYLTRPVSEPLLQGQLAYNSAYAQMPYNLTAAKLALDQDGWLVGANGIRAKAGQSLSFTLTASDTAEYRAVTGTLQKQWRALGVKLQLQLQSSQDLQNTLAYHNYDAILYGISIGVDPDVFVYWDSSQADIRSTNRLNLAEYKNATADAALEGGRTRLDPTLRAIKYKPFLQAWQQDAPALGLYQPRFLYLTNGSVAGLTSGPINTATDRFNNVQNWEIHQARVND